MSITAGSLFYDQVKVKLIGFSCSVEHTENVHLLLKIASMLSSYIIYSHASTQYRGPSAVWSCDISAL